MRASRILPLLASALLLGVAAPALADVATPADGPDGVAAETRYWPNGNPHSRGRRVDGLPEGAWEYWYQYGQRKEQGSFRRGERHGLWTRWYPNGQVHTETDYREGVRHGRFASWYRDGRPREAGAFVAGERHGRWIRWLPGDKGASEVVYEAGVERSGRPLPAAD